MRFKEGDIVPETGLYFEHDPWETIIHEVICLKGEAFPPVETPDGYYTKDIAAKERGGKRIIAGR